MANTYTLISSNTLTSSAASVTFSSIPATYTDLVVKWSTRSDAANGVFIRLNGDSSALYSTTRLRGDGASASSGRTSNAINGNELYFGLDNSSTSTANTFTNGEAYIPSYTVSQSRAISNFNVRENNAVSTDASIDTEAGLYTSSTTISSLTILKTAANFVSGSSFYLYGIKNS